MTEQWRSTTPKARAEAREVLDAIVSVVDDIGRELSIADLMIEHGVDDDGQRRPGDGPFAHRITELDANVRRLRSILVHRGMD